MSNDFHLRELADGQFAAHVNPAVNVRRVRFATGDKIISSFEFHMVALANQTMFP